MKWQEPLQELAGVYPQAVTSIFNGGVDLTGYAAYHQSYIDRSWLCAPESQWIGLLPNPGSTIQLYARQQTGAALNVEHAWLLAVGHQA